MSDLFRTCPDGHRCEHGSVCVEAEEGSYYCDCNTATGDYAGLSCEFAAEDYCIAEDGSASVWCTNYGMCERSSSNQWYCDCPAEYDGPVSVSKRQGRSICSSATAPLHSTNPYISLSSLALRIHCWREAERLAWRTGYHKYRTGIRTKRWFGGRSHGGDHSRQY